MKPKTKKILIGLLAIITILFLSAYFKLDSNEKKILPSTDIKEIKESTPPLSIKPKIETGKIPEGSIRATVEVSGKRYETNIPEKSNIYELMMVLMSNSKENGFTFNAKEYSGMGYFVDTINNIKGTPGAYWIYYINDKKASVGISQYVVKEGDIIRWSQEGI